MGTSDFAVASLNALVAAGRAPAAVISQPDKPKGRGYTMTPTPVSARAEELGIPVYKPTTLKNGAIEDLLKEIDPELNVVVAYGKILPPYVLEYPRFGSVNVHGSLLPMYRGAAPINRVLIDGCDKTGVTTMYMDAGLDTGDMIFKAETPITESDDFGSLHDRCAALGADLLVRTVDAIEDGTAPRIPQEGRTCYAAMIDNETRRLDPHMTKRKFVDLVRGLSPVPCAFCSVDGKKSESLRRARRGGRLGRGDRNGRRSETLHGQGRRRARRTDGRSTRRQKTHESRGFLPRQKNGKDLVTRLFRTPDRVGRKEVFENALVLY